MTSLHMEFSRDGAVATVKLSGRLDGNSAPEFGRAMAEQFAGGATGVVLDMGALEFVSSAGLRELMMLAKKLGQTKSKAVLADVQPAVEEVLEISGMGSLFLREEKMEEASGDEKGGGLLARLFSNRAKA